MKKSKEELYHYGILGMKWGVRRFQNEDGALTSAGKKRYRERIGSTSIGRKSNKKYTQQEIDDLIDKGLPIDYSRVDHKQSGDNSEAVAFVADIFMSRTGVLSYVDNVVRGSQWVSSFIKSKKYEIERNSLETDPTTGLKLKGREYTPDEDLDRVNPDYGDFNTNSKNNCMLCTVTYEMRRRGYDVTANKAGYGYFAEELERWFPEVKINTYSPSTLSAYFSPEALAKDVENQIMADNPEGSRGNLIVEWAFGGGHSMIYEIIDGKMVVKDGQTGEKYDPAFILKYCSYIQWARLDNVKFNPKTIKECCR